MNSFRSKKVLLFLLTALSGKAFPQYTLKTVVKDRKTQELLPGIAVTLKGSPTGALTDIKGTAVLKGIPEGRQILEFRLLGYKTFSDTLLFPLSAQPLSIFMDEEEKSLDEVTVSTTRTNSRIEDLPQKVEVIGQEDMEEENTIKPANIGSILGDLSVIHIQQTSAVNGSQTVRMQGLDGKYTQILRDGFPLYEGFSGNFGILQIPPLDLKQIEIIKGSAGTLYGGGAIAGLINIISKTPSDSAEGVITLNHSTLTETNANGYFSQRKGKWGVTFYAGQTVQKAVDVNKDGFSDIPEISSTQIHPTIFYYFNPSTTLRTGFSSLYETRTGGDMQAINTFPDALHPFIEKNKMNRNTGDILFTKKISEEKILTLKSTASLYDRNITESNYFFAAKQLNTWSEASWFVKYAKHSVTTGADVSTESFVKYHSDTSRLADYNYTTIGVFLQDDWQIHQKLLMEAGLRTDYHSRYNLFVLPRIAFMYKPEEKISLRFSSGAGYKTPSVFSEEPLPGNLQNLTSINNTVLPEKSVGLNMDINYHTLLFSKIIFQVNQAFYYTHITNPVIASFDGSGNVIFYNATYNINSTGTDTWMRFAINNLELYVGYNHTVSQQSDNHNPLLFSPSDKLSYTLAYEIEEKWRGGIESSLVAGQYKATDTKAPNYWLYAFMIERKLGRISIVANCENIFDYRQSRKEVLVSGTTASPVFAPLWGPIDGRVANLAIRYKF